AFALAVLSDGGLYQLILMFAGVALTMSCFYLPPEPKAAPRPYDRPSAAGAAQTEEQQDAANTPPSPCALPFLGERLVLKTGDESLSRLAHIASRLGKMTTVKIHPWGDLMARVSHELRTPLNAVIGFSDVMSAELFGP